MLASAFLGPDQSGVHRWLGVGPLSVNVAMLMLPAATVSLALFGSRFRWPWLVAMACIALLVMQPDRSQATAFGVAVAWLAVRLIRPHKAQIALIAATATMVVFAYMRPDPLKPVPEVEGIFQLAFAVSPVLAGVGLVSLFAFSATPAWIMRNDAPSNRMIGEALCLYFIVSALMPFVGAYPVPLMGVGLSPILGSWLAMSALVAASSLPEKTSSSTAL